jgi:hypothetical protein
MVAGARRRACHVVRNRRVGRGSHEMAAWVKTEDAAAAPASSPAPTAITPPAAACP